MVTPPYCKFALITLRRVRRHLYQFVPKSLDLFPLHRAVFFSFPSRDIICDKMIFSHANPSRVKNA